MGIALAVCGAGLYFMRSFKPALARDYDVFFAAIGLLCGGILFFQGWRLDPILQFGQFLLAGTTVFFAYESVRLRGIAADQARRSSYFDDEPEASPRMPTNGSSRRGWEDNYDQFEEPQPIRRRFTGQEDFESDRPEEDFYRPRRTSRAAIPEQAASRRRPSNRSEKETWSRDSERQRRMARFNQRTEDTENKRQFGERRGLREDQRRGSRPSQNQRSNTPVKPISTDRRAIPNRNFSDGEFYSDSRPFAGKPQGSPIRSEPEDVAFSPSPRSSESRKNPDLGKGGRRSTLRKDDSTNVSSNSFAARPKPRDSGPRDNNSRFDD